MKKKTDKKFAPGCALMLYKPELAEKLHLLINEHFGTTKLLMTCCQHDPKSKLPTQVINICPGCDKRFSNDYENISTISLWEILAKTDFFPFPDYQGKRMTIIDACPTRDKERVHIAVRKVLQKMKINLIEPENTRTKSICCGDSFYGVIATEKVKEQMQKRASEMPLDDVVVYCVSCSKSMFIGGKKPRYLIDLLFMEDTLPKTIDPDTWHQELNLFIEQH
jgi:Fe-S oxidoreductase